MGQVTLCMDEGEPQYHWWTDEVRPRQPHPDFRKDVERWNYYRHTGNHPNCPETDVLHFMTSMSTAEEQWNYEVHASAMGRDEAYRREFLRIYEEEEYRFQFEHDLQFKPSPFMVTDDYLRRLSKGQYQLLVQVYENEYPHTFPHPLRAMTLMREGISQVIWCSSIPANNAVIAVPNDDVAVFLRNRIGFRGHILDLSSLDYPGMDKMTAGHLCQFSECGLSTHIP